MSGAPGHSHTLADALYGTPRTVPAAVAPCLCLGDHRPTTVINHWHHIWPLGWGGPDTKDNVVALCPTGHVYVHWLLDGWKRAGAAGGPGRHNRYLYDVALDGWRRWEASR